jgi:putative peptidoglycan lipid II flippase
LLWRNTASLLAIPLIAQGNTLVERIVASWLGTSVVPGLDYARYISDTTLVLTAVPLGIVTLASHGGSRSEATREHSRRAASLLLLLSFPLAAFLASNAYDVVRVIYARGAFGEQSVDITGAVLAGASIGLGGTVTAYFLVKALNAQLRNLTAVSIIAAGAIVNSLFDILMWKALGPISLGLGASANGLMMLALAVIRLGLWTELAPLLGWLMCGCAGMVGLHYILPDMHWPIVRLAMFSIACAPWWVLLFLVSPPLRRAAEPVWRKLGPHLSRLKKKPI